MDKVKKLNKKLFFLEEKRKSIVTTFQVCREAMQSNLITPSERHLIRYILRRVLKEMENKSKDLRLEINEEMNKEK